MWEKVGEIAVDGGQVVVGDCAYARGEVERLHTACDFESGPGGVRLCSTGIGGSLAVIVSSGMGDGNYDVLVRRTPSKLIAELRVVFIPEGKDRCQSCHGCVCSRCNAGMVDVNEAPMTNHAANPW